MLAVTLPICEVLAPRVTEPEIGKLEPPEELIASTFSLFEPGTISNPRHVPSDPNPYALTTVDAGKFEILAVTLPICAVPAANAGRELIVTVVDASETGTVPLMLAVTVPLTVTALALSCVSVRARFENVTACEDGKLLMVTAAPTVTVTFSNALRLLESNATVTTLATVTVDESAPEITGALNVTTVGVSVICR
jgi:hypothetical protein